MFKPIFKYCFLTAIRDHFYLGLIVLIIISSALSIFLGGLTVVEQIDTTVTYVSASFRLMTIFGLITFICLHIKNMYDTRTIDFIFSRQISRPIFILSYWLTFVLLFAFLLLPLTTIFALILQKNYWGLLIWFFSMLAENMIVIAFAMTASLMLRNALLGLSVSYLFYFTSRIMGFFVTIKDFNLISQYTIFNNIAFYILNGVSIFLPRLDLFSNSNWLIHQLQNHEISSIFMIQLHALIYIPILLIISFIDLRKKEFD